MAKQIGSCICEFGGLKQDYAANCLELVLRIPNQERQSARNIADQARQVEKLTLSLTKYAPKRSLDANAYFWVLVGKLADVLNTDKTKVYQHCIREIGNNYEIIPVRNDAKLKWIENWQSHGEGWLCEDLGEGKLPGYSNVICYFGSSTYDSQQMSRLIDTVVHECKEQGIETLPPDKLELMKSEW